MREAIGVRCRCRRRHSEHRAHVGVLIHVLLQFGDNVFAVGEFTQRLDVWTNLLQENLPLSGFGNVDHLGMKANVSYAVRRANIEGA